MTETTVEGSAQDCQISEEGAASRPWFRLDVGERLEADDIVECYRSMAERALRERVNRVLIVGFGNRHHHSHLAARDALVALHEIGVPIGFRVAMVAKGEAALNGYAHAELEARRRGLRVRLFDDEADALRWLLEDELH